MFPMRQGSARVCLLRMIALMHKSRNEPKVQQPTRSGAGWAALLGGGGRSSSRGSGLQGRIEAGHFEGAAHRQHAGMPCRPKRVCQQADKGNGMADSQRHNRSWRPQPQPQQRRRHHHRPRRPPQRRPLWVGTGGGEV